MAAASFDAFQRNQSSAFASGAGIGTLAGLIGLGGAEFRLPVLISMFRFGALEAVIINKAMSLVVVMSALPFRTGTVSLATLASFWPVIVNLLGGSLLGAWFGASWATRLRSDMFYRVIAVLLVGMAVILMLGHSAEGNGQPLFHGPAQIVAGLAAGFAIGVMASLLGVAGGELLIPTLIILFGVDVKLAGSLSLAVSLPTMIVGFGRYSRDATFSVLRQNGGFVLAMAVGSVVGSFIGAQLLGVIPSAVLLPVLAVILLISSVKLWLHRRT
ncbi:MAG: sulfite exporter TauE/SafE family protein [Reyranella sp.]|uniref:sulfite exporter TauE/SafE family protein n=1 Tax=Reyranella sp. TaxID=1929291 RepID=UPI001AD40012|nr:sulfite exporter TauE/SafE family protein [Reyranella sp.]MBN9088055.1 sulfite exporter TauE/SafE family protein [Reyranella sp.]